MVVEIGSKRAHDDFFSGILLLSVIITLSIGRKKKKSSIGCATI
jgi:hypothetical protein